MEVKVYEGNSLDSLVEQAKRELGEEIDILYYEVEKERSFLPFFRKKKYKLFVVPKEKRENNEIEKLEEELNEVKDLLTNIKSSLEENKLANSSFPIPEHIDSTSSCEENLTSEFTGDALELIKILIQKGVKKNIAEELVKEACGLDIETEKLDLSTPTLKGALIKGIEKHIEFTGEFSIKPGEKSIIAFVGPTGVGKTTNLFKIASRFVIERDLKVGVITTDTFKVGAVQQARTYASILNIPFFVVTDSKKLKETVSKMENLDVIFIDTVGRSHYDYWRLGEIKAILSGINLNVTLLISCNYKTSEAVEIVNRYRTFFPIDSIFFTKIDETSFPGILINIPVLTGLPVSYISTGQRVPEDVKLLTTETIADYILGK
ncbi:flagellar biosynthesis protein FlhF [Desulfurobacterium thermolithotrophum]|uniref:flagellar biosynthesis protein FlhF n=1 Tax=Desulfurobacterium thermolithotrophum TaxID=64160 RepID=UPI0013D7C619|nr:flagellar biosynthesis protein FlhF [Desulfurobacterium thermolithotrophum]